MKKIYAYSRAGIPGFSEKIVDENCELPDYHTEVEPSPYFSRPVFNVEKGLWFESKEIQTQPEHSSFSY